VQQEKRTATTNALIPKPTLHTAENAIPNAQQERLVPQENAIAPPDKPIATGFAST
jgi:hypothetical protein